MEPDDAVLVSSVLHVTFLVSWNDVNPQDALHCIGNLNAFM